MKYEERFYQTEAPHKIRDSFLRGNNHICYFLSGGGGKSLIAKMILDMAHKKGSSLGFFSFRKSLIQQIKTYNIPNCDIGTLQKFGKVPTEKIYDLVIIDEKDFHDTKLKNNIRCKRSITLSGFPTDDKGYILDFDDIVEGVQYPDLVANGWAKPVKVLSTSKVDTSSLKKVGADFHKGQSYEMMEKSKVKRDLVDTYNAYCIGRKTLLFAIDTKHAESLKELFLENGIKCETVHSKKTKENDKAIQDFQDDKFDLLINVAMISIGVDIPCINTIMFARPMASVPLMMQCFWRGTRKYKDDYCLLLDCAEVIKRCDFHPMQRLDLTRKKTDKKKTTCCDQPMTPIKKVITNIDEFTRKCVTTYACKVCKNIEEKERVIVVEFKFCSECGKPLSTESNIEMIETKKSLDFVIECECGHKNIQRNILLTDAELKEVELQETLKSTTWEAVREKLKISCKRCGYKWQYSERLLEWLQDSNKTIEESLNAIDDIDSRGQKISRLMYGYFD